jgi:hypothetical protein
MPRSTASVTPDIGARTTGFANSTVPIRSRLGGADSIVAVNSLPTMNAGLLYAHNLASHMDGSKRNSPPKQACLQNGQRRADSSHRHFRYSDLHIARVWQMMRLRKGTYIAPHSRAWELNQ